MTIERHDPNDVTRTAAEKRAALAAAVRGGELVLAPGIFEMISAKLADGLGFAALYLTGYGVAASHLGLPDAGLASFADVLERARVIAAGTDTPLIVDADTGFGGLLNVCHTVQTLESAGCAALQIEDQASPKRCGLTQGARVIATEDMIKKIEVALDARTDPNLLIIARTDARSELGLEAAVERGTSYARAGADLVFVQGIETEDELALVRERTGAPCVLNVSSPEGLGSLAPEQLESLGCSVAIYPGLGMLAATAALSEAYESLRRDGSLQTLTTPLYDRAAMHRLIGFEDVWAFEKRWLDES